MESHIKLLNIKETLAVGMAIFGGAIDLRTLLDNKEDIQKDSRIQYVGLGKMNNNLKVLSSITLSIQVPNDGLTIPSIAKLTLYAARLDFKIKEHSKIKEHAVLVISTALEAIGAQYAYNKKTGNQFTMTIYDFGRVNTIEEVGELVNEALLTDGRIEGVVAPDIVKLHLTGCRCEEDVQRCAEILYDAIKPYSENSVHIQTYNIMCNSTYSIATDEVVGRKINIHRFVRYLKTVKQPFPMRIIYDNTHNPNKVLLLFPFDKDETEQAGTEAWREAYEVSLNIKHNGKVDQSSFSRKHGIIIQERIARIFALAPANVFR